MIVHIKKKHIDNGIGGSLSRCPVALAIKDALRTADVCVTETRCTIDGIPYTHTKRIATFIDRIDSGYKVRPTRVRLIRDRDE